MKPLQTQAVLTAIAPGVLLLIAALVARLLNIELAEVVLQLTAVFALVAGGKIAYNNVYSQRSVDGISENQHADGMAAGAQAEAQLRANAEAEHSDMWAEQETLAGPDDFAADY